MQPPDCLRHLVEKSDTTFPRKKAFSGLVLKKGNFSTNHTFLRVELRKAWFMKKIWIKNERARKDESFLWGGAVTN